MSSHLSARSARPCEKGHVLVLAFTSQMDQRLQEKIKKNKIKEKIQKKKTQNLDIVLVWGFTKVRSKPANVEAFVYDSLLEPDGTI